MDIEDKELFDSALTDEAPAEVSQEAPEPQEQPRDEHGRFAARQEPEPQPEPAPAPQAQQPAKDEAHVPSWRLREVREEAERRLAEERANWQRQIDQLRQQAQPRQEPQPEIDPFQDPAAFRDQGVRQAIDPIKSEVSQLREFYSRRDAERDHGAEKVQAAFDWIKQGMAQRDPEAVATYQRAMQSMHPFGELVTAHQQRTVYQQIGNDPNAWFEKELERRMSDPAFAAAQVQRFQQSQIRGQQPQGSTIKLPPSLTRIPAAQGASDADNDASDAALFNFAMR